MTKIGAANKKGQIQVTRTKNLTMISTTALSLICGKGSFGMGFPKKSQSGPYPSLTSNSNKRSEGTVSRTNTVHA